MVEASNSTDCFIYFILNVFDRTKLINNGSQYIVKINGKFVKIHSFNETNR